MAVLAACSKGTGGEKTLVNAKRASVPFAKCPLQISKKGTLLPTALVSRNRRRISPTSGRSKGPSDNPNSPSTASSTSRTTKRKTTKTFPPTQFTRGWRTVHFLLLHFLLLPLHLLLSPMIRDSSRIRQLLRQPPRRRLLPCPFRRSHLSVGSARPSAVVGAINTSSAVS